MRVYIRVLGYVLRYWKQLALSTLCMALFVVFSAFSVGMVMPFIDVLFNTTSNPVDMSAETPTNQVEAPPAEAVHPVSSPDPASLAHVPDLRQMLEKKIAEMVTRYPRLEALKYLCIVILVGFFFKNLFRVGQAFFMAPVEQGVIRDLRNELFEHMHRLSLSYFHGQRVGMLISRVTNDVTIINASITAGINSLFRDPLLILIYLAVLLVLSWKLTLVALIILPGIGIAIAKIGNRLKVDSHTMQERMADVVSILQESLYGTRVVKAFATEDFEVGKFRQQNQAFFSTVVRMTRVRSLGPTVTEFLGVISGASILYWGGREVLGGAGGLTPGEFLLFFTALFSMLQPLKMLGQVSHHLREGMVAARRVFEILDMEVEIQESPTPVGVPDFRHSISFEDVSFAYEAGEYVLENIDLNVERGQVVALVGPSGAGKSTMMDLLIRFYDPTEGRILIDGHDLRNIRIADLRRLIGIVTQETILFNDTVRNNIAYGLRHVPLEKIEAAARAANAHEFIEDMTKGYDTMIGDRGVKLSGGQRQRLAIARAILKNPPILILDEATSALDTESELLVQGAIEHLLEGRTALVIAHRLSTIRNADNIIVLSQGRIVEAGTHDSLIESRGLYRRLHDMQFAA